MTRGHLTVPGCDSFRLHVSAFVDDPATSHEDVTHRRGFATEDPRIEDLVPRAAHKGRMVGVEDQDVAPSVR